MKDLPPLQWLRAFESSARYLSFTRAAEELNITQSAVSQQIKLLENFLGESLFIRAVRSLRLTNVASSYLPDIQSALLILRRSTRANFIQSDTRQITIRSNWSFSQLWLAPRLHTFLREFPAISLNILPAIWEIDYQNKSDDIEIRFGASDGKNNEVLLREKSWCFPLCSPALARQIKIPQDMLRFDRINSLGAQRPWEGIYQLCGVLDSEQAEQRHLSTHGYMLAVEMARQNLGIMLGLSLISDDLISSGELVRLFDVKLETPDIYYLKADRKRLSEAENGFCDWLLDHFK